MVWKTLRNENNQTCLNCRVTTKFMKKAVAESFFKSLKTELIYGGRTMTSAEMSLHVFEYIEVWYNKKRRYLAIGNLTIDEFWTKLNKF